jgi:DnaJ-domain-containing protein 1
MQSQQHVEKQRILVEVQLTTGVSLFGYIYAGRGTRVSDVLNDPRAFLPFENVDGRTTLHAKTSILQVSEICNVTHYLSQADPYFLLGVRRMDEMDVVQRAFHQQISMCHPDHFLHRSPPQALIKVLADVSQRLNTAYQSIKSERRLPDDD